MFRTFLADDRGYALILTAIFLPIFIGLGLLVMDVGRGNNAQSDLQAAADTLALAGARELDGNDDAIIRAKDAMEEVANSVSFLGIAGSAAIDLDYVADTTSPFRVRFLKAIPSSDDLPIDGAWIAANEATAGADAKYVHVFVRSADLSTYFFNPVTRGREKVPVGATAVATLRTATCDLAPFFMCNPFATYGELEEAHSNGGLYGRLMRLSVHTGSSVAGPGNIGFLRIGDNGARATAEALAGKRYDQCLPLVATVNTQPGTITPGWSGFNTRFDMYSNQFSGVIDRDGRYVPAEIVRKGYRLSKGGGPGPAECRLDPPVATLGDVPTNEALAAYFGVNPTTFAEDPATVGSATPFMSDNALPGATASTAFIRRGSWNLFAPVSVEIEPGVSRTYPPYWQTVYRQSLSATDLKRLSRHPGKNTVGTLTEIIALEQSTGIPFVSRFDVYMEELRLLRAGSLPTLRAGGEDHLPGCHALTPTPRGIPIDRRTMLVAVVNCPSSGAGRIAGAEVAVPVQGYAKMFLVRPVDENGKSRTLDMELVDLTSPAGLGRTDEFLKTEALLVK